MGCTVGLGAESGSAVAIQASLAGAGQRDWLGEAEKWRSSPFSRDPSLQGLHSSKITGLPVEGQGTRKYSQTECTVEDLRNQLPRY